MPNQREVRWSQLKVGSLVVAAALSLAVLVTLMSGSVGGLFHPRITIYSHFENASDLLVGAPVSLQGVTIGTVKRISIDATRPLAPVEVPMRISTRYIRALHKDSAVSLTPVGVLGDTVVDIDSTHAVGPRLSNGDTLAVAQSPNIQDVIKSSQGTIQQVNIILAKLNNLTDALSTNQGTLGLLIHDPQMYRQAVTTFADLQHVADQINSGHGSLGKLINDDTFYDHANDTVTRMQHIADEIDQGQGSIGKLMRDDSLYENLNQTAAKANQMMNAIQAGRGSLGLLAKDPKFARKLNDTVHQMDTILTRLNAGQGSAGKLLQDPALYTNSTQTMQSAHDLLVAIRKNPKQYLSFKVRVF